MPYKPPYHSTYPGKWAPLQNKRRKEMHEEKKCAKCGFEFKEDTNWYYDMEVKWGHWTQQYPGKYVKTQYPNSITQEALRCKCERCGYQWLEEPVT
jgi:hypothetical protein